MNKNKEEALLVGKRIKLARAKCDITQIEACILLHCKQSEFSRWESGLRMPEDERLKEIADIFQTSFEWLKYGDEDWLTIEPTDYGTEFTFRHLNDAIKCNYSANNVDVLKEPYKSVAKEILGQLKVVSDNDGKQEIYQKIEETYKIQAKNAKNDLKTNPVASETFKEVHELNELFQTYPKLYQAYNGGTLSIKEAQSILKKHKETSKIPNKYQN